MFDQVFAQSCSMFTQYRDLRDHNKSIILCGMGGDFSRYGELKCSEEEEARRAMWDYMYGNGVRIEIVDRRGKRVRLLRPSSYVRGVPRGEQEVVLEAIAN